MCAVLLQRYHTNQKIDRHYNNRTEEDEIDNSDHEEDHKYILKSRYSRVFKPKNWFQNRFLNSNLIETKLNRNDGLRYRSRNLQKYPMLLSNSKLNTNVINNKRRVTSTNFHSSTSKRKETLGQILNNCKTRAMRYYRIWIYACNVVLFVSVFSFCLIGFKVLIFDFRRSLVPNLSLTQPSLMYAYFALFTQCGIIQLIGCLGALRLNEKLINAYWLMLLLFLFGDIVIGLFWFFNYGKICQELKPSLKFKLNVLYGYDSVTTNLWDRLQSEYNCCGVENVYDYKTLQIMQLQQHDNNSLLKTLLYSTIETDGNLSDLKDEISSELLRNGIFKIPKSCCVSVIEEKLLILNENSSASASPVISTDLSIDKYNEKNTNDSKTDSSFQYLNTEKICQRVYTSDCTQRMLDYIENTANILFIFGYCVVAFLKLCFLGILKYEIREMIQKIRVLKLEIITNNMNSNEGVKISNATHSHYNVPVNNNSNQIIGVQNSNLNNENSGETLSKLKFSRKFDSTESERETLLNDYNNRNSIVKELSYSNEQLKRFSISKSINSIDKHPIVLPSTSQSNQNYSFAIEPLSDIPSMSRRNSISSYELRDFPNNISSNNNNNNNNNNLTYLSGLHTTPEHLTLYNRRYRMSSPDTTVNPNI